MFHKVVWQRTLGVVGFLIPVLLQIYWRISQRKNFENRLRFDRDITTSTVSLLLMEHSVVYIRCGQCE